jgi:hypothetical protein
MHKTYLTACLALLLAACGGGSGGERPAEPDPGVVPDSAMASPEALVSYALAMQASADENDEPLRMPAREMPVSDTTEPVELD